MTEPELDDGLTLPVLLDAVHAELQAERLRHRVTAEQLLRRFLDNHGAEAAAETCGRSLHCDCQLCRETDGYLRMRPATEVQPGLFVANRSTSVLKPA